MIIRKSHFTLSSFILSCVVVNLCTAFHYGYQLYEQNRWHKNKEWSSCKGKLQSPIEIYTKRAFRQRIPAIEMVRYHDLLPEPLTLTNNGHSISLSIGEVSPDAERYKYVPYVFGGKLLGEYVLQGLHFHWGADNSFGSEHKIDHVSYPLEMHIIHRNRKYRSNTGSADELTVLAFFFQLRQKNNEQLDRIIHGLDHLKRRKNSTYTLKKPFTLASLLPPSSEMDEFYTYMGSLTTPPCSEIVTWVIFPNPLPISFEQMKKFRKFTDNHSLPLMHNHRRKQKLNGRRIFVRIVDPKTKNSTHGAVDDERDWMQNEFKVVNGFYKNRFTSEAPQEAKRTDEPQKLQNSEVDSQYQPPTLMTQKNELDSTLEGSADGQF